MKKITVESIDRNIMTIYQLQYGFNVKNSELFLIKIVFAYFFQIHCNISHPEIIEKQI